MRSGGDDPSAGDASPAPPATELDYRKLLDLAADPIAVHEAGKLIYANAAAAALVGAPDAAALLGKPMLEFVAPELRPGVIARMQELASGGGAMQATEEVFVRLDGSRVEVETSGVALGGSRTLVVVRDITRRRKAETAQRGAELRLRAFFQMSGEAIGLACQGRHVAVNPAHARLFGYAHPDEVVGVPVVNLIAPSERARIAALAARRAAGEPLLEPYLTKGLRRDGTEFDLEIRATGFREAGEPWTAAVLRDVTEQRAAERRLQESEQQYRALFTEKQRAEAQLAAIFDAAAEPMAFTVGGRFERVNGAFARMFGFARPEEAIGLSVGDLATPAELARLQARHRQRLAGEPPPAVYTTRGVRRDGTEFDVEVKTAGLTEGDSVATISILRDVTEQQAAERRLTEGLKRYRELFEFVPVSLWEVDGTGIRAALERTRAAGVTDLRAHLEAHPELTAELMKLFSVVAVNAFGRAMAGAKSMGDLLEGLDQTHGPETFSRYVSLELQLAEGQPVAHAEGWTGTLGGERRWVDTRATVIPGYEADWGRLLFASVDLTDRRRAEEERSVLQERLRQAEKLEAVGRLAGGVAHDFNNILSGILGYAELTAIELDPASDLHDHQQRIREAALRARDLVRQILAFGRRDRAAKRIVDVPAVVREALALMKAGVPSSVTLEVRIDPEAGAVLIDPTQLHQVVLNLCANARDAIGTYGHIEVAVDPVTQRRDLAELKPGRYVRLRVRDDGVGMDASTRARLFEPFMTTKGPSAGHGLGLAVVHGIVSGADGAILVESEPGKGSTFDVYLPRCECAEVVPPAAPVRAKGKGERILLVDDEPMVLGAHRRLLESLGYSVEIAADGEQALAMFRASPGDFDLVLTDQTMPRLSGMDLARAVLAIRADARIVLCTGYSDRVDDERASLLGLRGLLAKPIDREALAAAMERALGP